MARSEVLHDSSPRHTRQRYRRRTKPRFGSQGGPLKKGPGGETEPSRNRPETPLVVGHAPAGGGLLAQAGLLLGENRHQKAWQALDETPPHVYLCADRTHAHVRVSDVSFGGILCSSE